MRKQILFSLIFLGAYLHPEIILSQISYGGTPPSFEYLDRITPPIFEAYPDFDLRSQLEEDIEWENLGNPPRCAKIIPVCLNAVNNGEWTILPDGTQIWLLEIHTPDALAIMLYYDRFIIPRGGKLFLYNPNRSKVLGAFTEKTNPKRAEFATEFVGGDRIILEYVAPQSDELVIPEIEITGVAHGYNNLYGLLPEEGFRGPGNSGTCMVNINCPEGDNWQNEKKGIARIVTSTGTYSSLCSGTLINNTSCDFDPLFLSAFHCYSSMSPTTMNQSVYHFNFEDPGCPRIISSQGSQTIVGAETLALTNIQGGADGMLVRLNENIPEHYDVFFNGWDRNNQGLTSGVGIHHPAGDVKKISTINITAVSATWSGADGSVGAQNAHWRVRFIQTENGHSVTQGGSSGSPLFNQNKLIVGSLTGSNFTNPSNGEPCYNLVNGVAFYGKLWYHWNQGSQTMHQFLDPSGTAPESLRGISRPTKADFYP
ncbi:MAG: trypsin-like serine protease, partial [Marinilabiliaceae bacterium]|nr:trypsin-like serine protease [Marinilabiliaceae bacterium]